MSEGYPDSETIKDADMMQNSEKGNYLDIIINKVRNYLVEFRDIRVYAPKPEDDPNLTTEEQIKEKKRAFLQKYEDNIKFYPVRYAASKNAVGNMIYSFKAKNDFKVDDILLKNTSYNLCLNNFQAYTKSAGYNTNVEKYSTYDYRCNKKLNGSFCINEGDRVDYTYSYC